MIDVCTHCDCAVEDGAMKKYKLLCRRITCPTCPMVRWLKNCNLRQYI